MIESVKGRGGHDHGNGGGDPDAMLPKGKMTKVCRCTLLLVFESSRIASSLPC